MKELLGKEQVYSIRAYCLEVIVQAGSMVQCFMEADPGGYRAMISC